MSGFDLEVSHREIPYPAVDPLEAYARLKSYTPDRASFLLQSLDPAGAEGRYSVVGYRVRRTETMPPGEDSVRAWFELAQQKGPDELAAAVVRGFVGWTAASAAHPEHGLQLYPNELCSGWFMRGAAVLLYDHHERRAVVAGAVKGRAVERLIWELANAPAPAEPVAMGDVEPDMIRSSVGSERLQSRAIRAKGFLADEVESLILADVLSTPAKNADPLAVYQCWSASKPGSHGFFLDFGKPPGLLNPFALFGYCSTSLFFSRSGQEDGAAALFEQLPAARMLGAAPNRMAAKITRRLEDNSRIAWGGAVGYVAGDGRAAIALMDKVVMLDADAYWLTAGAEISTDSDPAQAPAVVRSKLRDPLRAVASVQAHVAAAGSGD